MSILANFSLSILNVSDLHQTILKSSEHILTYASHRHLKLYRWKLNIGMLRSHMLCFDEAFVGVESETALTDFRPSSNPKAFPHSVHAKCLSFTLWFSNCFPLPKVVLQIEHLFPEPLGFGPEACSRVCWYE